MRKISLRRKIEDYNYDRNKTAVENLHDYIKLNNFVKDRHYLEIDCDDYIAICPFVFELLKHSGIFMPHCVTRSREYFDEYFKSNFYGLHNLKVFFIKKDFLNNNGGTDPSKIVDKEFTCWLKTKEGLHPVNGHLYPYEKEPFYYFHGIVNSSYGLEETKLIIEKYYDRIMGEFMTSKIFKRLTKK